MNINSIWKEHKESLMGFILSKIKDEEPAKDILQETFAKAHLHQEELKEPKAIRAWLFRIAYNLCMDHFRLAAKRAEVSEVSEPEQEAETHSPADCLLPLIEQLPDTYRSALILSEIEGKKQKEVANILKISLSGAKSRIQRGRKLLQEGFMSCCDYSLNDSGHLVGENKSAEECLVCR